MIPAPHFFDIHNAYNLNYNTNVKKWVKKNFIFCSGKKIVYLQYKFIQIQKMGNPQLDVDKIVKHWIETDALNIARKYAEKFFY